MKKLDEIDRDCLANRIAEKWTENADIKDLERFYFDAQSSYLSELSDEELLEFANDAGIEVEQ